jgi:hypothetical protein
MDTSPNAHPRLTLSVDWPHIREAGRRAGRGNRSVSPFALALVEQSRYSTGRLTENAVYLTAFNPEAVHFKR